MSRFTAPLVVTPTEDYKRWMVLYSRSNDSVDLLPFGYDVGEEGSGLSIEVPRKFETDFASIPWFARWLIKTWGRHTNAAIIHDYLYRGGPIKAPGGVWVTFDRNYADDVMLEAMEVMNVRKWRRLVIYFGIRIGGGFAWRRSRKQKTSA